MKQATVRDLRYDFKRVEALLAEGEDIEILKRKRVIARLVPVAPAKVQMPDFMARMKKIYGDYVSPISNAELIARERDRY